MWVERVTGGGAALIEMEDAKMHLRMRSDESEFDGEVAAAIAAASSFLDVDREGFGGLRFPLVSQGWASRGARFCGGLLRLPFAQVTGVDRITYWGTDGAQHEVDPASYILARRGRVYEVALLGGYAWPVLADRPDAAAVEFQAGFADAASVPDDIRQAARILVSHFFDTRLAAADRGITAELKSYLDMLTARYCRFGF